MLSTALGRAVIGGHMGQGTVAVADLLLDFVNGVYRVNGVDYASFALAGGTLANGAAISGSGLACSGFGVARFPYALDTDLAMRFTASGGSTGAMFQWSGGVSTFRMLKFSGLSRLFYGDAAQLDDAVSAQPKAVVARQGLSGKLSVAGRSTLTVTSSVAPTGTTLRIGNDASEELGHGGFITKVEVFKGTFTDTQLRAMSA